MIKENAQQTLIYGHHIDDFQFSLFKTPYIGLNATYICNILIDNSLAFKTDIVFADNDPEIVINFIRNIFNVLSFTDPVTMPMHVHFNEFVSKTFPSIV